MTTVNLGNLSLGELQQVKKQLETEAGMLSQNIAALQSAESRFKLSKEACGQMSKKNEGKELLIPLTQSMYAPGTLADVDELLCDLGTGYFAGKTPPAAVEFFERKVRRHGTAQTGHNGLDRQCVV